MKRFLMSAIVCVVQFQAAGLACMVLGVGVLTVSQYLKTVADDATRAAVSDVPHTTGTLGSI